MLKTKMEKTLFKVFLKEIRKHQEYQKAMEQRPWSMDYIGIRFQTIDHGMTKQLQKEGYFEYSFQTFEMKRTYVMCYALEKTGLVRIKRTRYYKYLYLTKEGVAYVKQLKTQGGRNV